jgi:hypothetical protein
VDLPACLQIENKKTALDRARFCIMKDYQIPDPKPNETVRKVNEVLSELPFLVRMALVLACIRRIDLLVYVEQFWQQEFYSSFRHLCSNIWSW